MIMRGVTCNETRRELRRLSEEGWEITKTNGNHIRLVHPEAERPVFCSSTPSDRRTAMNLRADCRRSLKSTTAMTNSAAPAPAPDVTPKADEKAEGKRSRRILRLPRKSPPADAGNITAAPPASEERVAGCAKAERETAMKDMHTEDRAERGEREPEMAGAPAASAAEIIDRLEGVATAQATRADEARARVGDATPSTPGPAAPEAPFPGPAVIEAGILEVALRIARGEMSAIPITREMVGQILYTDGKAFLVAAAPGGGTTGRPLPGNPGRGAGLSRVQRRILQLLKEFEGEFVKAGDIAELLQQELGYASKESAHGSMSRPLRGLLAKGLVECRKQGLSKAYRLRSGR